MIAFSGADIEEMYSYISPLNIFLHIDPICDVKREEGG